MKNFEKRMVQVLHKRTEDGRNLAVGKTFKFESGSAYLVTATGAVLRVPPKPYRNKAERKRYLKARREDRGLSVRKEEKRRLKKEGNAGALQTLSRGGHA